MTTIICDAAAIAKVLRDVSSLVKPNKTLAILAHVLIDARDGKVSITATDMDMAITRTFAAEVETAGAFVVEAARFTNVVGSFSSGAQVRLADADGAMLLTSNRSRIRFPTLPATDFPTMPFSDPVATFDGSASFLRALAGVRHAFSDNETQYWLCGALLANRDGMEIVGTDGKRLSIQRPDIVADVPDTIIGVGAVDLLLKRDAGFLVEVADARMRFTWPDTMIIAKTVEGTFPGYRQIVPPGVVFAEIDGDELNAALNRIAMLSDDKERTVFVTIDGDTATIRNRGAQEGVEEMPCKFSGSEPFEIRFQAKFLRDSVAALDADNVHIALTDPMQPVKITSPQRPETTLVVMPMIS